MIWLMDPRGRNVAREDEDKESFLFKEGDQFQEDGPKV